eukprot:18133-Heterococcus_DN1.PRE.1
MRNVSDSSNSSSAQYPGPHVFIAAGNNEAAVWDLKKGGRPRQLFRVQPSVGSVCILLCGTCYPAQLIATAVSAYSAATTDTSSSIDACNVYTSRLAYAKQCYCMCIGYRMQSKVQSREHVYTVAVDRASAASLLKQHTQGCMQASAVGRNLSVPLLQEVTLPPHSSAQILPHSELLAATRGCLSSTSYSSDVHPAQRAAAPAVSMRALVGRISQQGNSYLITGGTDRHIRYWDFQVPSRCYTVSGNISSSTSNTQASIDCYSVPQDTSVTSRGAGGTDGCLVTVFKTPSTGNESSLTDSAPQPRCATRQQHVRRAAAAMLTSS